MQMPTIRCQARLHDSRCEYSQQVEFNNESRRIDFAAHFATMLTCLATVKSEEGECVGKLNKVIRSQFAHAHDAKRSVAVRQNIPVTNNNNNSSNNSTEQNDFAQLNPTSLGRLWPHSVGRTASRHVSRKGPSSWRGQTTHSLGLSVGPSSLRRRAHSLW